MCVVVVDELTKYDLELAPVEDQHPVKTLATDSADKTLGERIGTRRPDWRSDDPHSDRTPIYGPRGPSSGGQINKRIDKLTYDRRIAERGQYRARLKQHADAEGHERWQCPAAGPAPLVRCDLKPRSISRKTQGKHRIPLDESIRSLPPVSCTQQSVTIPPDVGTKFAQDLAYGSSEWQSTYNTLRNANEGYHGYVKDRAHEALDDPRRRRVHGVAAQTVLAAFLLLAANVRKIRAFLEDVAQEAGKLKRLPRRRQTEPLDDWLPGVASVTSGSDSDPPSTA